LKDHDMGSYRICANLLVDLALHGTFFQEHVLEVKLSSRIIINIIYNLRRVQYRVFGCPCTCLQK
jgi:hypothetical protein